MLRISKLADYAIVIMTHFAVHPDHTTNATALSQATGIGAPTVKKLLRLLLKSELLTSHQGAGGGYQLMQAPDNISVVDIITAIDGSIALTVCNPDESACDKHEFCCVKEHWHLINNVILAALKTITLTDMRQPTNEWQPVMFDKLNHSIEAAKKNFANKAER